MSNRSKLTFILEGPPGSGSRVLNGVDDIVDLDIYGPQTQHTMNTTPVSNAIFSSKPIASQQQRMPNNKPQNRPHQRQTSTSKGKGKQRLAPTPIKKKSTPYSANDQSLLLRLVNRLGTNWDSITPAFNRECEVARTKDQLRNKYQHIQESQRKIMGSKISARSELSGGTTTAQPSVSALESSVQSLPPMSSPSWTDVDSEDELEMLLAEPSQTASAAVDDVLPFDSRSEISKEWEIVERRRLLNVHDSSFPSNPAIQTQRMIAAENQSSEERQQKIGAKIKEKQKAIASHQQDRIRHLRMLDNYERFLKAYEQEQEERRQYRELQREVLMSFLTRNSS